MPVYMQIHTTLAITLPHVWYRHLIKKGHPMLWLIQCRDQSEIWTGKWPEICKTPQGCALIICVNYYILYIYIYIKSPALRNTDSGPWLSTRRNGSCSEKQNQNNQSIKPPVDVWDENHNSLMVKTHTYQSTPLGKACVGNEMIENRNKSVWEHTLWRADNQRTPETCLSEFPGACCGLGAL